jgi:hypothetical protein
LLAAFADVEFVGHALVAEAFLKVEADGFEL